MEVKNYFKRERGSNPEQSILTVEALRAKTPEKMIERALASLEPQKLVDLTTTIESVKDSPKRQFRFNKQLGTSKYNEFLVESDDEELFRTKPKNHEGKDFAFGFKIDAFRDEIKFKRNGSEKEF
jgi:hypothetical protein